MDDKAVGDWNKGISEPLVDLFEKTLSKAIVNMTIKQT